MAIPLVRYVGWATTEWTILTTQYGPLLLPRYRLRRVGGSQDRDWVFDNNMEWVIERATVYDTTDVSAEDTAFLGFGSDPSYQ